LDAQQIFDKVAGHLLTQNRRATTDSAATTGESCRYRLETSAGPVLRCGIGGLIPDDAYDRAIEGVGLTGIRNARREGRPLAPKQSHLLEVLAACGVDADAHMELLVELQAVHDSWDPPLWPNRLACVARQFWLARPPLLEERLAAV
jgi:hypothetical protein